MSVPPLDAETRGALERVRLALEAHVRGAQPHFDPEQHTSVPLAALARIEQTLRDLSERLQGAASKEVALAERVERAERERDENFEAMMDERSKAVEAEAEAARLREALRDSGDPIMDSTFRARLLRHGLSNQEIAEFVDAVESREARVRAALSPPTDGEAT